LPNNHFNFHNHLIFKITILFYLKNNLTINKSVGET
jgi:hypothetical protein